MAQKIKVLVADDMPEMANRLIQMLSELEHADFVGPALDGREALELYQQHRPSVAILDLHMPKLNGLQVLTAIRAADRSSLIIMFTSESSDAFRDRCLQAGANHYIQKSADIDCLLTIIRDFVRKAEQTAS